MKPIPWTAAAMYRGRERTLHECLSVWHRDARSGRGALATISCKRPVQLDGWPHAARDLDAVQCLQLIELAPDIRINALVR